MNVSSEKTVSLWMDTEVARASVLDTHASADAVIIGSGIAGLSVAYELAVSGLKVIVLDRGPIGKGMTSRTTAHLAPVCDDSMKSLTKRRGVKAATDFHRSQAEGVDRIEEIQAAEEIDCDFRRVPGYLFPAGGTTRADLEEEMEACREARVPVEKASGLPFKGKESTGCLRFPHQATFHPLLYLRGLARAIERRHGRLFAESCVAEIEEAASGVTVITAAGNRVRAGTAVVATNSPINDRFAIHTKQAPYRTYAMAVELGDAELDDALYWDTLDPYHYVRLQPMPRSRPVLIVGGEDHKTGATDDGERRFRRLETWIRRLVPKLGKITHRWSGQIMDTIDFAGFIGKNPGDSRIYVSTGDSGQGMTHGAVAGLLIAGAIVGKPRKWAEVYEPSRKPVGGAVTFVSENTTVLKSFAEYVAPGEVNSLDKIERGQGAIVRQGLAKIAAYRDRHDKLHLRSAVCTHLGCHIHWNSLEKCWDCPCHGSHFGVDGEALNGPAVRALAEVALRPAAKAKKTVSRAPARGERAQKKKTAALPARARRGRRPVSGLRQPRG
jgi:glycine/D-amino acid oxidase-like deaminating enzyme/nitrite reductase/ring-hydroxylating ferredoxin subunit